MAKETIRIENSKIHISDKQKIVKVIIIIAAIVLLVQRFTLVTKIDWNNFGVGNLFSILLILAWLLIIVMLYFLNVDKTIDVSAIKKYQISNKGALLYLKSGKIRQITSLSEQEKESLNSFLSRNHISTLNEK